MYLNKLLMYVNTNPCVFKSPNYTFILGLTASQIKELKKVAISKGFIRNHKNKYYLTDLGKDYLDKNPIISWCNATYPKRPEINLEYLKGETMQPTITKAIRNLARHLLEHQELKQYSNEWNLKQELLSETSSCNGLKADIKDFLFQGNKIKLEDLYNYFKQLGITKSIISVLLLDILNTYKSEIAIYKKQQFQIKLSQIIFDEMMFCPQNFEVQRTIFDKYSILEDISEIILPIRDNNILNLTKGLMHFMQSLDKYTIKTKHFSKRTLRFRNIVLNAKEPINLFVHDIPKVLCDTELKNCGFEFVETFDNVIQELQNAVSNLELEILIFTLRSFKAKSRDELTSRFEQTKEFIGEKELIYLYNNITEKNTTNRLWIQRIATFVNKKRVPKDWSDEDVADYKLKIQQLALKFTTIERTIGTNLSSDSIYFNELLNTVLELPKSEQNILLRQVANN